MIARLESDLYRLRAPNPSPMTGEGTNTYILGQDHLCVIDPGPDDPTHFARLMEFVGGGRRPLTAILVTHSHVDHSSLARPLAAATGAAVLAFGDSFAGRSEVMQRLAQTGLSGGGEGVDSTFQPDSLLADGDLVPLGHEAIRAIWTPGHFGNHLSFRWRDAVFSGDLVMGWTTSLISPPDGDMTDYMRALCKLEDEAPRCLYPGHGDPVTHPISRICELRRHRQEREAAILAHLGDAPHTIPSLVKAIYAEIPESLHSAAERNVFAHLVDLHERNRVFSKPELRSNAIFAALGSV